MTLRHEKFRFICADTQHAVFTIRERFADIRTSRHAENELWHLARKPGSRPVRLGLKMSEGAADMPRTAGEIKSLATGTTAAQFKTSEYLVGMNARSWGQLINGHVASLGPVAILKDGAKVAQEPDLQFIPNAQKGGKETPIYKAVANTYEGDGEVLYRVFALDPSKAPVSCMDIVFDTRNGTAKAGEMFYPKNGDAFVADFKPVRR